MYEVIAGTVSFRKRKRLDYSDHMQMKPTNHWRKRRGHHHHLVCPQSAALNKKNTQKYITISMRYITHGDVKEIIQYMGCK